MGRSQEGLSWDVHKDYPLGSSENTLSTQRGQSGRGGIRLVLGLIDNSHLVRLQEVLLACQGHVHKGVRFQEVVEHRCDITLVVIPS